MRGRQPRCPEGGRAGGGVAGTPRGASGDAERAGGRGWGVSRRAPAPGASRPAAGRRCPPARAPSGRRGVGSGGAGRLGRPWPSDPERRRVASLLVTRSLASSAPNPVEVSMMRKFYDTRVRKRLADSGAEGRGRGRGGGGGAGLKGRRVPQPPVLLPRSSGLCRRHGPRGWHAPVPAPGDLASAHLLGDLRTISLASGSRFLLRFS